MPLLLPKAVLFDMDGTLTEPRLDFPSIKDEMGIPREAHILEALEAMSPEQRRAAETVLHRHEEQAAADSVLNPGCRELLHWVNSRGLLSALITRNSRRSVQTVLSRHGLHFEVLITREDGRFKPDPAPLLLACRKLHVAASQAWMVGDGSHDVVAGNAAGIFTVWISHGKEKPFRDEPQLTVRDLPELSRLLADAAAHAR